MTRIEAFDKTTKYNYLVGKKIGQDVIAAIMPIPITPNLSVEQMFTIALNNLPYDKTFSNFSEFRIAVMLNYQQFLDKGQVIWKDINEVLEILGIEE